MKSEQKRVLAVGETCAKARLSGDSGLNLDYFLCETFPGFPCLSQISLLYTSPGIISSPYLALRISSFSFLKYVVFACFLFFFFFQLLIYLFMAVSGLRFCARAFSSCGKRGPLFIAVRGPLTIKAFLVVEHRLQTRRLSNCGSRA